MNFVGKFDAQLPADGLSGHAHVQTYSPTAHAPADAIIVPDAHLLFGADFKRSGVDLILSNADRELVVHDYFKGEHRLPLASPDGAHLTGAIVNALTGQVQYAQAGAPDAAAHVIGHVTKLSGSATAIRNGVSVILNNGDNVEKGDVVATGSDSTLGITFIDGTVFGLASNARMVLNEMVYDPNGSNNSSLISLVAGTISFVAGETAKHGDMKVDTPVATMGIRGTAVLVEIDFNVPNANGLPDAKFQVLVEPDGSTGSYILFDKTTLDPIATVNKAGQQVNINQNGISYTNSPLSPELQKLISDVFSQKFTDLNNSNTKNFDHFTDSVVPQLFQPIKGLDGIIPLQTVLLVTPQGSSTPPPSTQVDPLQHIDQAPKAGTTPGQFIELKNITGSQTADTASGIINFNDINVADRPTASTKFNSVVYQNAQQQDISHGLTPTELAAVQAVEVALNVVPDPANKNNGSATWSYNVPDGSFDFLGAGETLTLTYIATVNNNFAPNIATATAPITITITGSNDVPVITSAVPHTITFNSGTSVPGGDLTTKVATSGMISFDDPDLTDIHTVSVSTPTATLTDPTTGKTTAFTLPPTPQAVFDQALTVSLVNPTTALSTDSTGTGLGTVNWNLADLPVWLGDFVPKGDTLTLTYVVTVTDSQGATAQQDITVTITGTDAAAEVWIATTGTGQAPDGLWSTGSNWETGNAPTASDDAIIITDQLEGLTPTYPVTITSAAEAHSLKMDNYGGNAPVLINQSTLTIGTDFNINDHSTDNPDGYTGPELDNQGTLTVGGAFNLNADSIVDNSGTVTVDGKMEVLDQSTVNNSGTIKLAGGGDFSDESTISNTTTDAIIEVSGGTLNVEVDISNQGTVKVDSTAALTLSSATVDGGAVTNNGTLTLNGGAVVKNGTLGNAGQINASGTGNALDNEQVTNTGGIEIAALGALTLDLLTTVTNTDHTITVDDTGTLTLQGGASITGGSLSNSGTVDIEGTGATLDGVAVTGSGAINVDAASALTTLVLKDAASITNGTLTVGPTGILSIAGDVTLDNVGVTNQNSIEVTAGNALTLDDTTTLDNSAGTVTIDGTGKLTLNDAEITGGAITDNGTIDITGSSKIDGDAVLNGGNVTVEKATLTLDNVTVNGSTVTEEATGSLIQIDATDRLTLEGGATIKGATGITGAIDNAGTIEVAGPATLFDEKLTNTASGSIVQVDGNQTLTLSGTEIVGGTINNFSSGTAGTIDITGSSKIDGNAVLNGGNVTVEKATLTLDNVTVNGSTVTEEVAGSLIQIDATDRLTLEGGATLKGAPGVTGAIGNAGTIEVAGPATLLDEKLTNTASGSLIQVDGNQTLTLSGTEIVGGTINNFSSGTAGTIDITGSSKIDGNAVLNDGNVTVENATLTLSSATIDGSAVTVTNNGTLTLNGGAVVKNGMLGNAGQINASGTGNALDKEQITNTGGIEIAALGALTLDLLTTVTNTSHTITVDDTGTLTLQGGTSITGGSLSNSGTVDIEGTGATLDGVAVTGGGAIDVDAAAPATLTTLVLEDTTSITNGTLTVGPTGILSVAGDVTLDHVGVTNQNSIEVTAGNALTLDDATTLDNSAGTVTIDGTGKLTLNDAEITGGTITDNGTIDITGSSKIDGDAALNGGHVTIEAHQALTLDGVTVTGTSFDDAASGATIQVDGATGDTLKLGGVSITGGGFNVAANGLVQTSGDVTLTNVGVTNDGTIEVTGGKLTITGTGSVADSVANDGGTIQIDGGAVLDLNVSDTQNISFAGTGGKLQIDTGSFDGSIVSLAATDQIDLTTIGYGPGTTGTYVSNADNTGGTLTITDGTHSIALQLVGDYRNAHFAGSADSNGDTLVTLNANDDAPVIASDDTAQSATVAELTDTTGSSAIDDSTPAGGVIHFTDIDLTDRPTATVTLQTVTWSGDTLTDAETSALGNGFQLTPVTNTNNGQIAWTYAITDGSLDFLGAGQTATVTSTVTLDDHQGGHDTATVTVTIDGSNDAPVLAADTSGPNGTRLHAITERAGKTGDTADTDSASSTLSFTDVDLTDTHTATKGDPSYVWSGGSLTTAQISALTAASTLALTETDSTHSGAGSVGLTYSAADKTFDFLAAGETLTVTYDVTVADNSGVNSSQPVTFTITGSNDAPVLAADTSGTNGIGLHAITERAGKTGDAADIDSASGTLSFTDVDLNDTHTATKGDPTYVWSGGSLTTAQIAALTAAGTLALTETDSTHSGTGSIGFTYSAADNSFDFLAAGQTLTVTYDVDVTDNSGVSSSQPVTFTITGTNDAPTLVSETDPATQTIILTKSPIVLSAGTTTNSLGLATENFDKVTAGSASNNGDGHGNFTSTALGATFSGSGHAGVVNGSSSVTAAPFIGPSPGHADTTNYLSIGANGSETITFATEQDQFGLYWGSVDSFNTIKFYDGSTLVASYSGADIAPLLANGTQGSFSSNGYVEFSDLPAFTKVVLASGSSNAFEIDNISAGDSHIHLAAPITGTITVNDADIGDTLTASVTGNAVAEYNGSTTLPSGVDVSALIASGAITFDTVKTAGGQDVLDWTYNPANADLDFLQPGDKLTLTFNATVSDGHATTANQPLTITLVGNGSSVVSGTAQNDTFTDVSGSAVKISGDGGHDIYNFNAHFGSATITDFDVNNDVIDISSTSSSSVTALLNSAVASGANTVITDSTGDTITLDNVSVAQLKAHPGAFQLTIANGGTFEVGASTSENVVFEGSTGKLTIDTPSSFSGVISGFTGDGTLAGSDQIDLKGIDQKSASFTESFDAATDTLLVSDGTHSATLHFNGTYQAENFSFTTDNNGGTIVYDPPVSASTTPGPNTTTQAVTSTGQGFVFNFADSENANGAGSAAGTHQFDGQTLVNVEADPNKPHDDGHGQVSPVPDSMDAGTSAIVKAQLHVHDFHFV